ncbi:unnamed protein product [Phytophthora fragariaefolia]|uniref:Unnamed protein product n=1 Tax=Phytophthora fragariaefolia TaxID=1490495 RepID=A0A9W6WVB8_9STRA|nr:unnamed protein product [Phytophthora fragariaefolia]
MPKSNVKTKNAPRATEATPKDAAPSADKSSPKETTPQRANGATSTDSDPDVSSNARKAEDFLNSSDTQDPKGSASATPHAKAPQERSPPSEDDPDPVDYEESETDQDREQGEVPDLNSSPQLSEQQRVTHPGSPMTPKTAAAVARVEAQAQSESHRDTAPTDMPEQQIITNAGIDEGVPPEQLQPDNRRHLSERTPQETSQATGTKRECEASTPRTREHLLALRYWTLNEYREHLRLSRRPGPGVSQCDKCPVVLQNAQILSDVGIRPNYNNRRVGSALVINPLNNQMIDGIFFTLIQAYEYFKFLFKKLTVCVL